MPYEWTTHSNPPTQILTLRPWHQIPFGKGLASFFIPDNLIPDSIPVLSPLGTVFYGIASLSSGRP